MFFRNNYHVYFLWFFAVVLRALTVPNVWLFPVVFSPVFKNVYCYEYLMRSMSRSSWERVLNNFHCVFGIIIKECST